MCVKEELISVIMSCYNEKIEWIEKSIDSILNQSYNNIEVIIIDDNPKDEKIEEALLKYANKDNRVRVYFNNQNRGLIYSLNKALNLSKGNYIARMDADDISYAYRFEREIQILKSSNIDFVMSSANYIDEKGMALENFNKLNIKEKKICFYLRYKNISIHPTWMFKRGILDKLKKYNEILYAEDYDFLCRAILNEYKIKYIDEPLIKYRVRNSGVSKSKKHIQEIISQIISKNYKMGLKDISKYNPEYYINRLDTSVIERFRIENIKFNEAKLLLKSRKKVNGSINILYLLLTSNIKRKEMINKLCLQCICKLN